MGSGHLQPGEESTAEALLAPQKTEAGRHGALAALSRLVQTTQRMVGDLDLDSVSLTAYRERPGPSAQT